MDYKSPGVDSDRMRWILGEIRQSQSTLDSAIVSANNLPDSELSKTAQILRLNSLKREVDTSFVGLDSSVLSWANRDVPSTYKTGWFIGASQTGASYDFSLPHREALDILSNDAYDDVATRLQQYNGEFGRKVDAQKLLTRLDPAQAAAIQGKSRSAVAQALLTGEGDPRKVAKKLADDLWEDGVTIVDAGGNKWQMENYTRMLVRTKTGNAYNSGTLNKYIEEGVDRVGVLDGIVDDQECAKANGETWSIKYAVEHVLQHPNCRRAFVPRAGKGRVNQKSTEEKILQVESAAQSATQLLDFARALYDFRQTGEVRLPTADVVKFTTEFVADKTGLPIKLANLIVDPVVKNTFGTADEFIEALIDPVLFAAGFIRVIPPRAVLMRSKLPLKMVGELEASIKKTNLNQFGTEQNQQTIELLDSIEKFVKPALDNAHYLNKSAAFYRGLKERDAVKMLKVISNEFRKVNKFGEIVDDVLIAVLAGRTITPDHFAAIRTAGVDELEKSRLERFADSTDSTIAFTKKLRTFYRTGELDLGSSRIASTLASTTSESLTEKIGVPPLVANVLARHSTAEVMSRSSVIVESYIDPVFYSIGLIQRVSDRGALLALSRPENIINDIANTIIKANQTYYGTKQHPKVVEILSALDARSAVALERAGYVGKSAAFYKGLKNRDVNRMFAIATRELRNVNDFGTQVDGVYKAVLDGTIGDVITDQLSAVKSQMRTATASVKNLRGRLDNAIEEMSVVFADLTTKAAQLRQFLEGGAPSVTRLDVVDNLMRVEQPQGQLEGYEGNEVRRVLARVDEHLEDVRKQRDELAGVRSGNFGRPQTETVGDVLARVSDDVTVDGDVVDLRTWRADKAVPAPAVEPTALTQRDREVFANRLAYIRARNAADQVADDADVIPFPKDSPVSDEALALFTGTGTGPLARTHNTGTGARSGLPVTAGGKPPDPTGGRKLTFKPTSGSVDPISNTDLLSDAEMEDVVAGLVRGFDEEASSAFDSDVLDDYVELFNRVKADGEDGPLFLEMEQFIRPIGDETTFEAFENMTQSLSLFRVVDGKAAIFGDTVSVAVEEEALNDLVKYMASFRTEYFVSTSLWQDAISYSDNPMSIFRHLSDADPGDFYARGLASQKLFDDIHFQIIRAVESDGSIDLTGPQVSSLHKYLGNVYGTDNVESLVTAGANGSLYKVTDSQGRSFIVKPMTAQHGGPTGDVVMSHALSDWLSITIGEPTQVIHTTVVPLKQGVGQHIAVMPYFDGEQLRNAGQYVTGNSMARLELFDRIAIEADPNWGNTMVNTAQRRAVSIDTETAFGIIFDDDIVPAGIGYTGNRVTFTKNSLSHSWDTGVDDLTIGFKAPSTKFYDLTDAEELFHVGAGVSPRDAFGVTGRKVGSLTSRRSLSGGSVEVHGPLALLNRADSSDPMQLPIGKATLRSDRAGGLSWEPVIFASPNEAETVRRLAKSGEVQGEIRDVVASHTDSLQPRSLDVWVSKWSDVDELEDAIDQFTLKIESNLRDRARSMLNDGSLNTTGGVTTHIGDDGTRFVLGQVVELDKNLSKTSLTGIVTNIYDDADGVRHVVIANQMGTGKSFDELLDFFSVVPPSGYDKAGRKITKANATGLDEFGQGRSVDIFPHEWRAVDIPEEYPNGSYAESVLAHFDATPQKGVKSLRKEPLVAEVPVYNRDGVFAGYGRENIEIIVVNPGDGGIRFTDDVNETFISWERIVDDGALNDIVRNQLRDIPPSERPRTVRIYFSPIENETTGKQSFGFMRMDEREMHLSVQSATQIQSAPGAKSGRTSVKLGSVLRSDEELIAALDWHGVGRVSKHEINHSVDAGREEAQRVTLSVNLHKQLLEEHPDVVSPEALDDIARKLIPDSYEPPRLTMTYTEELVDYRASIIEDIDNSRLVRETQEVIEDAIKNDVDQPWMHEVYKALKAGDPDAHHEFFADWASLMDPNISSRKRILDALDDPDKALAILERRALTLPKSWDPDSRAYARWLSKHLDGPIIPRKRSAVRGYWKAEEITGKSLAADIARQFAEGAEDVGGTIHLTGYVPEDGIAVARKANEKILTVALDADGLPNEADMSKAFGDYIKKNRKDFLTSDDWNLGYWVSPEGDVYLDVTRVIESGDIDAAHFGYREGQRSMFDLRKKKLILLEDDPIAPDFKSYLREYHPEIDETEAIILDAKIGASKTKFGDVVDPDTKLKVTSKRIEEIRDKVGKLVPISFSWMPPIDVKKLNRSFRYEYRFAKKVRRKAIVKKGKNKGKIAKNKDGTIKYETVTVPLKKRVIVTKKKGTQNLTKVLEKAEEYFGKGIVPDSLGDKEWLTRRNVTLVNQATADDGAAAMADLRAAFKLLDDNLIARPPDGFDFIVRTPTSIRHISGKGPAPNGISVGRRTYISTKWKNLSGTMSRNRPETILHEIGHQLDPTGSKGKSLRLQGFKSVSKYGDLNDDEFWSEAFVAVITGRADEDLTAAVLDLVKFDRSLVRRNDARFYVRWQKSYLSLSEETGIPVGRIVANASHQSAGMDATVNHAAGTWMARMVSDNYKFTAKDKKFIRAHYRENIDIRLKSIAEADDPTAGNIVKKIREVERLRLGLKQIGKAKRLLDIDDDLAGAFALQALAQQVSDKVLMPDGSIRDLTLVGAYGMPQVVRGYSVLRGSVSVNDSLGDSKIRSFYNNIIDPKDLYGNGDVTVDFHMANMFLFVLGMQDSSHAAPAVMGVGAGLRPLIGDTIRELYYNTDWGERLGADSPAELQEVLWEIWRLGLKEENAWWGDLPTATRVPYQKLVDLGWEKPLK